MACVTLEQIINKNLICISQTPYMNCDEFYINYPLHYLGIARISQIDKYLHEFPHIEKILLEAEELQIEYGYGEIIEKIQNNKKEIQDFKMSHRKFDLRFDEHLKDEYFKLIKIKKELINRREKIFELVYEKINKKYNIDISQEISCIKIRGIALCNTIENVVEILPQLKDTHLIKSNYPLFSYNLNEFSNRLKNEKSAIEGGPCLIGVDEIYLCFIYKNGKKRYYDIMTGFEDGSKNKYKPRKYDIIKIIERDRKDITDVSIYKKRYGPTLLNAIEIYRLMLISKKLNLPLVIGLPDEAYRKSLSSVLALFGDAENLIKKLNILLNNIVDEFLNLISVINKKIKLKNFEVLHSRNDKSIKLFYQYRSEITSSVGEITNIYVKKEAIIDYICLPAVPNFIWGCTNILEINNIMELENVKASIKFFPQVNFSALIFPYIPDINNNSSMYHGNSADKIFIESESHMNKLFDRRKLNNLDKTIICQIPWL